MKIPEHTCGECSKTKPLDEDHWHKDKANKVGYRIDGCKACRNKRYNRKYKKHKIAAAVKRRSQLWGTDFERRAQVESVVRAVNKTVSVDMEI